MKIAVYYPKMFPAYSIKIYTNMIIKHLQNDVDFVKFTSVNTLPNTIDIFWDPQTGGGHPTVFDRKFKKPTIITMHGAALFSLPLRYQTNNPRTMLRIIRNRKRNINIWKQKADFIEEVITVSKFGKNEATKYLPFQADQIIPIHHGIDFDFFKKEKNNIINMIKTFIHVSQYQPKKNIGRIIKAFEKVQKLLPNIELLIISPGYSLNKNYKNIKLIDHYIDLYTIKNYYHKSISLLFPSLHETFGFPILEAMASGLPVITSRTTACGEIAQNNAILVNPQSIKEISKAMLEISTNKELSLKLINNGYENAKNFTWKKSADKHLEVFYDLLER